LIAVDSSSLRRYFDGKLGVDVERVARAIENDDLILPVVVVAETLSDPALPPLFAAMIKSLLTLDLQRDYWVRSGELRANTLRYGYKAKLADVLTRSPASITTFRSSPTTPTSVTSRAQV